MHDMGVRITEQAYRRRRRKRYIDAVLEMKRFGDYDFYVSWHLEAAGMVGASMSGG